MTIESFQDTLFEDPIGLRFRHAREKARWSLESVAQQLKLPVAVLDAIEREDWVRLGAPIFVRSYVGSYARFLGLPTTLADDVVRGKPAPQLVTIGIAPPARRAFDRGLMNLAYLALTVLIVAAVVMLAMYFQSPRRTAQAVPLDPPGLIAEAPPTMQSAGTFVDAGAPSDAGDVAASLALMAPGAAESPASAGALPASGNDGEMLIRFVGDSWVEIVDHEGRAVERGMMLAGDERRFPPEQLSRVTLGDAASVEVRLGGKPVDLSPYREANVARFTVSSAGGLAPLPGG